MAKLFLGSFSKILETFPNKCGYGNGYAYGKGNGIGYGDGDGYGYGYGDGYGNGYGYGNGAGYGYGKRDFYHCITKIPSKKQFEQAGAIIKGDKK